ncbi:unnamed protein product, partial [Mesorhabditis belari]|uniref:Uncharacterized protein n=1 Tax=Mesorhabditis belari TaxID=2138241 RepID=A0AAF3F241_9BILA
MFMLLRSSLRRVFLRRFASTSSREPKFSESAAFQGKRPDGKQFELRPFIVDYYKTDAFKRKQFFSFFISLAAFVIYFGWLREASDIDDVWNSPPHVLTANLERKMIQEKIDKTKREGKATDFLEAELAYVDVKAEAMRLEYEKQLNMRTRK